MGMPVNPFAPNLSGELSERAAAAVLEIRNSSALSPFATRNAAVQRRSLVGRDLATPLRPAFVRDAEKIIHTPAYNRMGGKTQVFSFRCNDDLARRGLHVQLVSRIARDIGRALGLNLDLIEAIALGHDIGHTPFGHAGERFLNAPFHERTGQWFFHNVQSVRVLDVLAGRNVSLQTLDGIICHNGEFEQQVFETSGLEEFDTFDRVVQSCWNDGAEAISRLRPMTLEGCVVRVSDIIAYVGKDRQDAIRAGICGEGSFADGLGGAYNAWALAAFAADVVENSVGRDRIAMSAEGFAELRRAKRENWERIYGTAEVSGECSDELAELFERLYYAVLDDLAAGRTEAPVFRHHIRFVEEWLSHYDRRYAWEDNPDLCVVDYISSMTDDYFMAVCKNLFPGCERAFPQREHF